MANMIDYQRAAEVVGVRVGTLYSWVSRREIPHVRLGPRLVRFDQDELRKWLDSKRIPPRKT